MSDYQETIRNQVENFVVEVKSEFGEITDYIEGIDSDSSVGLNHLDEYNEEVFNENPLEVSMGIPGIDVMSFEETEELDERVKRFADKRNINVRQTGGSGDHVEYTFFLHGKFLDVPN